MKEITALSRSSGACVGGIRVIRVMRVMRVIMVIRAMRVIGRKSRSSGVGY